MRKSKLTLFARDDLEVVSIEETMGETKDIIEGLVRDLREDRNSHRGPSNIVK